MQAPAVAWLRPKPQNPFFSLKRLFFRGYPKRNSLPAGRLREIQTSSF
jgi:hypothetical protein